MSASMFANLMQALLVLLLQSTGLLLLGLLALRVTHKHGPAVQTLVGRTSLASVALLVLLLPLTGHVQPVMRVSSSALQPALYPAPLLRGALLRGPILGSRSSEPTPPVAAPLPQRESAEVGAAGADVKGASRSALTVPAPLPPTPTTPRPPASGGQALVPGGFLCVTAALLLWLGVCQWHLTRLRRASQPITTGPAVTLLAELTPNPPRLLTHSSVHSPFLAGYCRPVIFLPVAYAADFDADALRAIFVHELAHRDRRDNLWTLAARLLCAALWPQPLLWLLVRRLEHISEDACDEAVLAHNCPPRAYANCLLFLATRPPLRHSQRTLNAGVAPFRSSVGRRINRILTLKGVRPMSPITLRLRLTAAALTVAAALGGAFLISSAPAQTTAPAPFVPTPQELQYYAEQKQDLQNLKEIGLAMVMYEQDHHERIPDAKHWMDQITPYLQGHPALFDPFQPGVHRYGYAFNRNCSGKPLFAFAAPAETVEVFDSTLRTRNASDTGQSLRTNPQPSSRMRHLGSNYVYIDGHAKFFMQGIRPSFSLKGGQPSTSSALLGHQVTLRQVTEQLGAQRITIVKNDALAQAQVLAGLTLVQGPGVIVTLTDSKKRLPTLPTGMTPPSLIHDSDINQVVNELKAAGAEAIAVNGQRLVTTGAIRTAGPTILINNTPQTTPYVIKAIGDPKALTATLNMSGGLAAQLKLFDPAMFSVQQAQMLTLPAYSGGSEPRYAKPVSELTDPVQQKLQLLQAVRHRLAAVYNKKVNVAPSSQIGGDKRQRLKLQAQIVQIDAQIAVLNQIASSHQVH